MRLTARPIAVGILFSVALLLAGSSFAASRPSKAYPRGVFIANGHRLAATDILDARAIPDMAGKPSLMVTLSAPAAAAIQRASSGPIGCTLDGKAIGTSPADSLSTDHVLQITGAFPDYDSTAILARRISGRDPLPDAEGDE